MMLGVKGLIRGKPKILVEFRLKLLHHISETMIERVCIIGCGSRGWRCNET